MLAPLTLLVCIAVVALAYMRPGIVCVAAFALSGIVRVEPAPTDLRLDHRRRRLAAQRPPLRSGFRRASRSTPPLLLASRFLSAANATNTGLAIWYVSISDYLAITAAWLTGAFADATIARRALKAYVIAATVAAIGTGLVLELHLPGYSMLVYGDSRAQGLFKDPNVFGPYLVPAAAIVLEEIGRPRLLGWSQRRLFLPLAILGAGGEPPPTPGGGLEKFHRGRDGDRHLERTARWAARGLKDRGGGARRCVLIGFALLAATGSLTFFSQRSRLEAYDAGRFANQATGFDNASVHVLGYGPGQAEERLALSTHSTYVRAAYRAGLPRPDRADRAACGHRRACDPLRPARPRPPRPRFRGDARCAARRAGEQRLRRHHPLASPVAGLRPDLGNGCDPSLRGRRRRRRMPELTEGRGAARATATMLAGRLSSNAGFFVAVLVIARALGPADRGAFAFVSVTGLIVAGLASFGIGPALAVLAARHPGRRRELAGTGVAWGALAGGVAGLLLLVVAYPLRSHLPDSVDVFALVCIAVSAAGASTSGMSIAVLQGSNLFHRQAVVTAATPWIYVVILVIARLTGRLDLHSAIGAWVIYWLLMAFGVTVAAAVTIGLGRPRLRTIRESLSFGARAWVGTLSVMLNARVDQVLMGFLATEAALGIYAVAVNVSEVLLYLPAIVGQVLLPRIAGGAPERTASTTLAASRQLLVFTGLSVVVAGVLAPPLIPLVFGQPYAGAVRPFLLLPPGALSVTHS